VHEYANVCKKCNHAKSFSLFAFGSLITLYMLNLRDRRETSVKDRNVKIFYKHEK